MPIEVSVAAREGKRSDMQSHEEDPKPEAEKVVAGPGVVGTESMWQGAVGGGFLGALIGGVIALIVALLIGSTSTMVAIITIAGAAGGWVAGFVIGGYLNPTEDKEMKEDPKE